MQGDECIKYADAFSRSDGMKITLMLGGCPHLTITTPLMIFRNPARNYPINGIPDVIPGVFS